MRTLSAVLSRAAGHEALLELINLSDDVEALKVTLARMWHRLGDGEGSLDEPACDEILQWIGEAYAVTFRLSQAYQALDGGQRPKRFPHPVSTD
jgi:hypothetical protein